MDRPLDDMIVERQGRSRGGNRRGRRDNGPRDGVRKQAPRSRSHDFNSNWVHDRFEDDPEPRRRNDGGRERHVDRYEPNRGEAVPGKLRVDNVHWELSEKDLRGLFETIGKIDHVEILYDRQDRSRGIAYVTYADTRDATDAIKEFNGANAMGQPIHISQVPMGPRAGVGERGRARNPFDSIEGPKSRSLFERIDDPGMRQRRRSASPIARDRNRSDIDRYIPGERRSRSPQRRRGGAGRRPGQRREDNGRRQGGRGSAKDTDGRPTVGGRPRKTVDELDAEMDDYFGPGDEAQGATSTAAGIGNTNAAAVNEPMRDDEEMMIE